MIAKKENSKKRLDFFMNKSFMINHKYDLWRFMEFEKSLKIL